VEGLWIIVSAGNYSCCAEKQQGEKLPPKPPDLRPIVRFPAS